MIIQRALLLHFQIPKWRIETVIQLLLINHSSFFILSSQNPGNMTENRNNLFETVLKSPRSYSSCFSSSLPRLSPVRPLIESLFFLGQREKKETKTKSFTIDDIMT